MNFIDFCNQTIQLEDDAWEHIQEGHPEVTIEMIKVAPEDPVEVRRSRQNNSDLYYHQRQNKNGKLRYTAVVVKKCPDGSYISSAMTTAKIKDGERVFQKDQ